MGDLGLFEHGDSMGDAPSDSSSHHVRNNYHEQLGNENEGVYSPDIYIFI